MQRSFPFVIIGLLLLPMVSHACIAGMVYEKEVGEFKAEMSYNAYKIRPGQNVRFHFYLYNITHRSYGPGNPINYDYVEAVFREGSRVVLTQKMERQNFEETAFDYTLPKKNADYVLDIRYVKKEKELAALSLPVRVGRGNVLRRVMTLGMADAGLLKNVSVRKETP